MNSSASALQRAIESYRQSYGEEPSLVVRSPGRVNLIGEHTDYNDGFVLPFAIDRAVYAAAGRGNDGRIQAYSIDLNAAATFDLDHLAPPGDEPSGRDWSAYVRGVAWALRQAGRPVPGANLAIAADLPQRSGLSSSAALELAVAATLQSLAGFAMRRIDLALLCQRAEHEFAGVRCGVMDQVVVACAEPGAALFLDTRSLRKESVPIPAEARFIVVDSGANRSLAASGYNRRRAECERVVAIARSQGYPATALRDLALKDLEALASHLDNVLVRRGRHVVEENARVLAAVAALKSGDLRRTGQLMTESHESLRDLYEVSTPDLDAIVQTATEVNGVYGARVTGAGFGGAAIALVDAGRAVRILEALRRRLDRAIGRVLDVLIVTPAGAADPIPQVALTAEALEEPDGRKLYLYRFDASGKTIGEGRGAR